MSSGVVTVNFGDHSGNTLSVNNLSTPIRVQLKTSATTRNETTGMSICTDRCRDAYDIAHHLGACEELLQRGSYSCVHNFCPTCEHKGFCDYSCGFGMCSTTDATVDVTNCTLSPVAGCSFLNTTTNSWQIDGELLGRSVNNSFTCGFDHLTDFGLGLGDPPQANRLPPPTFNLSEFARKNIVGLVLCVFLFVLLNVKNNCNVVLSCQ
jgi:hypothetical protein